MLRKGKIDEQSGKMRCEKKPRKKKTILNWGGSAGILWEIVHLPVGLGEGVLEPGLGSGRGVLAGDGGKIQGPTDMEAYRKRRKVIPKSQK